ncbi:hypothetical protein HDU91_000905 [Kappamyces sp. JEL0680]|nr:hypothetical protein HDU91_000905 [Kappamyces sp. JEL0680]
MVLSALLFASLAFASDRDPNNPLGGSGKVIAVRSATDFCMFLPPNKGASIASSEGYPNADPVAAQAWAVSFCTAGASNPPSGSKVMYPGLILSADYYETPVSKHVIGKLNPQAAGLVMDGGGFFDLDNNVNSPPGGMCEGFDSFYNQVDPADGIYCVICCKGISTCRIDLLKDLGCAGLSPTTGPPGGSGAPAATTTSPQGATTSVSGGASTGGTSAASSASQSSGQTTQSPKANSDVAVQLAGSVWAVMGGLLAL